MRLYISELELLEACKVAARASWMSLGYEGAWDTDCPDPQRWVSEEREALEPALRLLGISVLP